MGDNNSIAALRLAASLAGAERALLLVERVGAARIAAAIDAAGDRLARDPGLATAATLEALARSIDRDAPFVTFTIEGGRGGILLPGVDDTALPERARAQLHLLAAAIADSIDERARFAYADHLSEGVTIYRFPDNEPEIEFINRSAAQRIDSTPEQVLLHPRALFGNEGNRALAFDLLALADKGTHAPIQREVRSLAGASYWVQLQSLQIPASTSA